MAEIIGVRFKRGGKIYYFQPNEEELEVGSFVIVETIRGTECGEVVFGRREIPDEELNHELKTIIRKATPEDMQRMEDNKRKAARAFDICNEKIKAHGLDMNLLEVEYTFDNSKILFSFSAEGRVDFRELVKDLASVFRTRIELRQIGVRDEAKMLGGLGVCGRPFCCKQFMGEFQSVSIKMAKEQGLSLNPVKISGTCGRLMCCLKHEQDAYEDLIRTSPRIGSTVITPDGKGVVTDQELIAGKVK
ncbi:MAG: stage 0 sporulation family protein, partial [Acutalibacteraceae bacterium]